MDGRVPVVPEALVREVVAALKIHAGTRRDDASTEGDLDRYARRVLPVLMACVYESRALTDFELGLVRSLDRSIVPVDAPMDLVRLHQPAPLAIQQFAMSQRHEARGWPRRVGAVFLAVTSQIRASIFADRLASLQAATRPTPTGSLLALLSSTDPPPSADELSAIGFLTAPAYVVAVARSGEGASDSGPARKLVEAMSRGTAGPYRVLTGDTAGGAVCLIPTSDRSLRPHAALARKIVAEHQMSGRVAVALSGPSPGAQGIAEAFRQASETVQLQSGAHERPDVMTFREAGPYLLLRANADLCVMEARPLERLAADEKDGEELIRTVDALISTGGNTVATARVLGIHRHTVYARAQKIERATGYSFDDPTDRFCLDMGVRARDLMRGVIRVR